MFPRIGGLYRHFKGSFYVVKCVAMMEKDFTSIVVYHNAGNQSVVFARPFSEWFEHVERDGYSGPRFREVHDGQ